MSATTVEDVEVAAAPPPDLPLHIMKMAVARAHELLKRYYPQIIKAGGATQERADKHLPALLAAMEMLDKADRGFDIRPTLALSEKVVA